VTISATVINSSLLDDPTVRSPGFHLPRRLWSLLNRFRTGQGHCGTCRKKWSLTESDRVCDDIQTMSHIVNSPFASSHFLNYKITASTKILHRLWPH